MNTAQGAGREPNQRPSLDVLIVLDSDLLRHQISIVFHVLTLVRHLANLLPTVLIVYHDAPATLVMDKLSRVVCFLFTATEQPLTVYPECRHSGLRD